MSTERTRRRFELVSEAPCFCTARVSYCTLSVGSFVSAFCRCGPVHPEVPGCGSTDGVFLLAEETSALCAETRASGKRGKTIKTHVCLTFLNGLFHSCLSGISQVHVLFSLSLQDVSELRNELQRKEILVQKHLAKLHHWQQVLEDLSGQHRKPTDLPPPGPLTFLEQASASLPHAPLKPN